MKGNPETNTIKYRNKTNPESRTPVTSGEPDTVNPALQPNNPTAVMVSNSRPRIGRPHLQDTHKTTIVHFYQIEYFSSKKHFFD
jgi:hypothetical protein